MGDKTSLGDRMKNNYENRTKQFLTRRLPTIIRLDGKAFHTYTRGLERPFDEGLIEDMQNTTIKLCEEIQGCKMGYTQSDEITLVLTDYDKLETSAWFDYNVQKMTSVAASIATAWFNYFRMQRYFCGNDDNIARENDNTIGEHFVAGTNLEDVRDDISSFINYWPSLSRPSGRLAMFDARVFQIPEKEEVVNCLIWRQQDAERNSIQMLAQSLYSHKELHGKNTSKLQDMCFDKGHNWNNLHWSKKRGSLIVKTESGGLGIDCPNYQTESCQELCYECKKPYRTQWEVVETPIFTKDRDIILNLI
jgi:tRNA(His) 5'-end guanylyltransferase